jgi:hypothetical protein
VTNRTKTQLKSSIQGTQYVYYQMGVDRKFQISITSFIPCDILLLLFYSKINRINSWVMCVKKMNQKWGLDIQIRPISMSVFSFCKNNNSNSIFITIAKKQKVYNYPCTLLNVQLLFCKNFLFIFKLYPKPTQFRWKRGIWCVQKHYCICCAFLLMLTRCKKKKETELHI